MDLKKCSECGRTFASHDGELFCKRCMDNKIEDDFKKVRDYLYMHPGADIKVVSDDTGVSEKIILRLLREDRIEVVDEETSILKCTSCGTPIKSGKLCDICKKNEFAKDLKRVEQSLKEELANSSQNKNAYYSRNSKNR